MRQQRIANLQTPLRDRRRICGQIIGNYYEARELGALTDPNGPQPNMDILLACYRASAESVRNGSNRYAIDRAMLGLDDQPSTDVTADLEEPVLVTAGPPRLDFPPACGIIKRAMPSPYSAWLFLFCLCSSAG